MPSLFPWRKSRQGFMNQSLSITFSISPKKQKLVRQIPLDRLCLETDSPALAAEKQTRNEPCNVRVSCDYIASIKKVSSEEVRRASTENALSLFPKLSRFFDRWILSCESCHFRMDTWMNAIVSCPGSTDNWKWSVGSYAKELLQNLRNTVFCVQSNAIKLCQKVTFVEMGMMDLPVTFKFVNLEIWKKKCGCGRLALQTGDVQLVLWNIKRNLIK